MPHAAEYATNEREFLMTVKQATRRINPDRDWRRRPHRNANAEADSLWRRHPKTGRTTPLATGGSLFEEPDEGWTTSHRRTS